MTAMTTTRTDAESVAEGTKASARGAGSATSAERGREVADATVTHGAFTVERTYRATPARVFAAFADPAIKRRWFAEGEDFEVLEFSVDFRVGGRESSRFRFGGAGEMRNETVIMDIVPERRIVFAYSMAAGEALFSASLGTVVLAPSGEGTVLAYTEQGAFFAGADGTSMREAGWSTLLDALGRELEA